MDQMEHQERKTDVLKDWMDRDMAVPPSSSTTCCSSTTSSDNRSQVYNNVQQQQSCLPSLESFLFLPQLPVNGDDDGDGGGGGVDEDAAAFFRHHHYPRQYDMRPQQLSSSKPKKPSSTNNLTTKSSSSSIRWCRNPFSSSPDYENDHRKNSCQQLQSPVIRKGDSGRIPIPISPDDDVDFANNYSNIDHHHVCGGEANFPSRNSSPFSFIAANDPVIGSSPPCKSDNPDESNANVVEINNQSGEHEKRRFPSSSSMSISFVKGIINPPNRSHNPFCFAANHQHPHLHRYPHQNHRHHCSRRRILIFRICQALSVLLFAAFLLNLVKNSIWAAEDDAVDYKKRPGSASFIPSTASLSSLASSRLQHRLIQSWNMPSMISPPASSSSSSSKAPDTLSNLTSSNGHDDSNIGNLLLLDVPNFRFLMNNKTKCNIPRDDNNYIDGDGRDDGTTANEGGANTTIFFMIIVHSAPQNFQERQAIRETWGSLQRLGQFQIRLVFLLGQDLTADDDVDHDRKNDKGRKNGIAGNDEGGKFHGKSHHKKFYAKIRRESQQYGDIVTGNFHDSYRNLTYKHLMGYLWVLNHCSHAKFVLKADDDAFIDIFQLFKFVIRTFGQDPEAALICNVFPEGTKPVRQTDRNGKKWAVTYEEYPYETYPKYCGGLAYLVTPNIIHEIYRVSENIRNKYLWIDDVYVTGMLREMAHVEPFYLNLRYSYDPEEYRKWLFHRERNAKNNKDQEIGDEDPRFPFESNQTKDRRKGVTAAASGTGVLSNEMRNGRRGPTPPQKIPFMIVHLERGSQLGWEMRELWNKTWDVWSQSGLIL